jgi:hypothetical protein
MRFRTIGGLMLLVVLAAIAFGSLRSANYLIMMYGISLTVLVLAAAPFWARFAAAPRTRAWWFWFAALGWAHLLFFTLECALGIVTTSIPGILGDSYLNWDRHPEILRPDWERQTARVEHRNSVIGLLAMYLTVAIAWAGGFISDVIHARHGNGPDAHPDERDARPDGGDARPDERDVRPRRDAYLSRREVARHSPPSHSDDGIFYIEDDIFYIN